LKNPLYTHLSGNARSFRTIFNFSVALKLHLR